MSLCASSGVINDALQIVVDGQEVDAVHAPNVDAGRAPDNVKHHRARDYSDQRSEPLESHDLSHKVMSSNHRAMAVITGVHDVNMLKIRRLMRWRAPSGLCAALELAGLQQHSYRATRPGVCC